MNAPVLELWGVQVLRSPVTVLTNLILAIQALWLTREVGVHAQFTDGSVWRIVLRLLAVGAGAGALKHAAGQDDLGELARVVSNLAIGAAVLVPAWALASRGSDPVTRSASSRGAAVGSRTALTVSFLVYGWCTAVIPSFLVPMAFAALMLLPVAVHQARRAARGAPDARLVLAAVALGSLAGVAYVLPVHMGPWVGPADIAHVVLMGCFPLLAAAARAERRASPPPDAQCASGSSSDCLSDPFRARPGYHPGDT